MTPCFCRRLGPFGVGAVVVFLVACGGSPSSTPTPIPANVLVIVTPTPGAPPPRATAPDRTRRHVVQEGDTLFAIAAQYGVSEEELMQLNQLADPDQLFVGEELIIPPPEP